MGIYDLTTKQNELAARLMWADEPDEIEALEREIASLNYEATDFIKWLSSVYAELNAVATSRKERAQALAKQAKTAENAAERLRKKILETALTFGIKKIETDLINWSVSPGRESCFIDAGADFISWPTELVTIKTETVPDKKGALKYMQDGHELPGAHIVKNPYLIGK